MQLGFLSPWFLLGLAAIAVPLVLHLLRRHADPVVPFSAVRLLRRAPVEQARRRRLREWLLLALRVAALALLAFAFARPYLQPVGAAASTALTVVAVDRSYSMASADRWQRARTLAHRAIDRAAGGEPVALVGFDDQADVLVRPTVDRGVLHAAVDRLEPGPGGTRYGAALATAAELTGDRTGHLVLITDLQRRGWNVQPGVAVPRSTRIDVEDVGAGAGNIALVDIGRTPDGVNARLASTWPSATRASLTVTVDGRVVGRQPVDVAAGGTVEAHVRAALPRSGALQVHVDDPGGYPADDDRYMVLDPPARQRVLLVSAERRGSVGEAYYLERAIAAAEPADRLSLEPLAAERLAGTDLTPYAAIVVFAGAPLDRRGADRLAEAATRGTGVLVVAGPSVDVLRIFTLLPPDLSPGPGRRDAAASGTTMAAADVRHPVFDTLAGDSGLIGSARFRQFIRFDAPARARVLARFGNGAPALMEISPRVLVLATDLANAWNDFPLHPAFVPFVHGLIRYVCGPAATVDEMVIGDASGTDATHPGVVWVRDSGGANHRVAVNVDTTEADPARMSAGEFVAAIPTTEARVAKAAAAEARTREREQSLWRYGLMLMLVALVAESAIGRRV